MASSVATQLERQFGQIPGLSQMTSSSGTGFTEITLQFDRSRTVDSAAIDVQAAINATQAQLPISLLTSPIYRKTNPADTPILLVSMTSDVLPIMTVSDYAYSILAQKVSQVSGVGLVTASSRCHAKSASGLKRCGFSCGRDDLAPRGHRRGAEHAV
jgi:multidrug efflux pump subunit AcrB